MIEIKGKCGISAKIILDSVSPEGNRLTTMEITYPRIILAELNTHRMLSKNSSSSRAIPFNKMIENLGGIPVRFGAANKGMQDTLVEHTVEMDLANDDGHVVSANAHEVWKSARDTSIWYTKKFYDAGYHKQIYNRLLEPFQMMKTVISGTEWQNFFWLRCDGAADPSLQELANCMKEAYDKSEPEILNYGDWHLPYINTARDFDDCQKFWIEVDTDDCDVQWVSTEEAIQVSCARSCAVSFRNTDYGLEKSKEVYGRLINDERIHGSALEHAAQVMQPILLRNGTNHVSEPNTWEDGISHADREGNLWSGNFKGFIQNRKTIKGECK